MSRSNDLYKNCSWLEQRTNGKNGDGDIWLRARLIYLLSKNYRKKLREFEVLYDEPVEEPTKYSCMRSTSLADGSTEE